MDTVFHCSCSVLIFQGIMCREYTIWNSQFEETWFCIDFFFFLWFFYWQCRQYHWLGRSFQSLLQPCFFYRALQTRSISLRIFLKLISCPKRGAGCWHQLQDLGFFLCWFSLPLSLLIELLVTRLVSQTCMLLVFPFVIMFNELYWTKIILKQEDPYHCLLLSFLELQFMLQQNRKTSEEYHI